MKNFFMGLGAIILITPLPSLVFLHSSDLLPTLERASGFPQMMAYMVLFIMMACGTTLLIKMAETKN